MVMSHQVPLASFRKLHAWIVVLPYSLLKNECSVSLGLDRAYWKFVTAICATFFAKSYVALRLPPMNRTLPVTS